MNRCFNYAIARLHANPIRGERLNLGIVVFDDRKLTVHPAKNFDKIKAISAALDPMVVEESLSSLQDLDKWFIEQGDISLDARISSINSASPVQMSNYGMFFAHDADAYNLQIDRLLTELVEPEPAPARKIKKRPTKLLSAVRAALKAEKILADKNEGFDSHRVVTNYEIVLGLTADLMLKNGAMHVVQTVDASHSERARHAINEIGTSVLVFEQARMHYGSSATRPRILYSSSSQLEKSISPSLEAAQHQGAELINWESREDRIKFIVEFSSLAEPLEIKKSKAQNVIASVQHRLKLN